MENKTYDIGTKVIMKKGHPCGANLWEVVRLGADIKLKCTNCNRVILISRVEFNKKLKKVYYNLLSNDRLQKEWIEDFSSIQYIIVNLVSRGGWS